MYSLGLDSLTAGQRPAFQPVAIRVYALAGETPSAYFDVTEDDNPCVLQMSASAQHLDAFGRALTQALALAEKSEQEVEVRLLRVPALNFAALRDAARPLANMDDTMGA